MNILKTVLSVYPMGHLETNERCKCNMENHLSNMSNFISSLQLPRMAASSYVLCLFFPLPLQQGGIL